MHDGVLARSKLETATGPFICNQAAESSTVNRCTPLLQAAGAYLARVTQLLSFGRTANVKDELSPKEHEPEGS